MPLRLVDLKMCFESTGGKSWQIPKDCEGFGSTESDKTRDAKLMSLCMLFLGLVNGAPTCIYIYCIWINMDQVKCPGFLRSFCSTPRQAHSRHSHIDFVIFRDSCWILLAFEGMIGDAWMHVARARPQGVLSEGLFNALSLVCNLATHVEQEQDTSKPALLPLGDDSSHVIPTSS